MTQQVPTQQTRANEGELSVTSTTIQRRPGLVTFAAVMMFVTAGFFLVAAITEWSNSIWLYDKSFSVAGSHLVFWGFVDFGLCLLSVYAAYQLLAGGRSGQVVGFLFAGISLVRWMFYIPADPWLALSIMVIDGLIIYGLAAHDEWFESLP